MSVALFLPGPPPKADDSIGKITAMLVEHRRAFLVGGYVAGLSVLCYLWFAGSVWRHLTTRTRDQTGLAIAAASLLIVSAVALFIDHGPFQFGGPVDLGGGLPAVVWIAALSLAIARRSRDDDVSEARP